MAPYPHTWVPTRKDKGAYTRVHVNVWGFLRGCQRKPARERRFLKKSPVVSIRITIIEAIIKGEKIQNRGVFKIFVHFRGLDEVEQANYQHVHEVS